MLAVWVVQAIRFAFAERDSKRGLVLRFVASACLLAGALGFFGSALSSLGGLNFLPPSFEWPNYGSDAALKLPDGQFVVPHTATGRIQVYDLDLSFVRGWTIDADGGVFALAPSQDNRFFAYTARGNKRIEYDVSGNLLSSEYYRGPYPRKNDSHLNIELKVSPILWPFTNPIAAWLLGIVGLLLVVYLERPKARDNN